VLERRWHVHREFLGCASCCSSAKANSLTRLGASMLPTFLSNAGTGPLARAEPAHRGVVAQDLARTDIGSKSPQGSAKKAMRASNDSFLGALIFSAKTFAGALLALFISFWLALDEPYWALLTAFVVAQPDSGLVLAKGFYRLLGTAAGILVTIALVFALAQYGELFVASLAAWIGLCSFAARATRNFAAYGFQLDGYTVAIGCGLHPRPRPLHRNIAWDRLRGAG
jgi:hypothetical protein